MILFDNGEHGLILQRRIPFNIEVTNFGFIQENEQGLSSAFIQCRPSIAGDCCSKILSITLYICRRNRSVRWPCGCNFSLNHLQDIEFFDDQRQILWFDEKPQGGVLRIRRRPIEQHAHATREPFTIGRRIQCRMVHT